MRTLLAAALTLGLAGTANAVPIAFTSSGAFSAIANCTAANACAITSSSGTNNVLDLSGSNNGTLTANGLNFAGATDLNDATIGIITWANRNATSFDTNFGVTYTLTLNFTAPNADAAGQSFALTVAQATGSANDQISGLTIGALPSTISLAGVIVSDFKFSIQSGSAGSIAGGVWSVPPCANGNANNTNCVATSTLLLTADFTAAPAQTATPEPASLALLGAGILGLGMARRRRA